MRNWIPHSLTLSRIFIMPLSLYFLAKGKAEVAFVTYALLAITDFLDGYTARKLNTCSHAGVILDQVSDKIVGLGFFAGLWVLGLCPLWFFSLILSVTFLLGIGYLASHFSEPEKSPQTSLRLGKWNMALQYLWVGGLILQQAWQQAWPPAALDTGVELKFLPLMNQVGFILLALLQIKVFMDYGIRWCNRVFHLPQHSLGKT